MTEQEREELIEKITQNISVACGYRMTPTRRFIVQSHARAALDVAEPVIREQVELELRVKNVCVYGTSHPEIYKTVEDDLREENARLRSILATKMHPPFDDDLTGEPYATKDRQPEPGGLGRVGKVEGGRDNGGA